MSSLSELLSKLSVVIPIHNEAPVLFAYVEEFLSQLRALPGGGGSPLEIILVENGSQDASFEECRRLEARFPGQIKTLKLDRGSYGLAVRTGLLAAKAEVVATLEIDFLISDFVARSLSEIAQGRGDFIVASKRHPESRDDRPFKRRILTFLFNLFLKVFFRFEGTDTHGLKLIRSDVASFLVHQCLTSDETFQTELVMLARVFGYSVREMPVQIAERRPAPIPVFRRIGKVLRILGELHRSLSRFPKRTTLATQPPPASQA